MSGTSAAIAREYRAQLITRYRRVDFRGIRQVRHMLQLELEELYVPSRAVAGLPDYSHSVGRPYEDELGELTGDLTDTDPGHVSRLESEAFERLTRAMDDGAPLDLNDALRRSHRLIVLGDPGTGKSTFVKWLALTYAAGPEKVRERLDLDEDLLPILVPVAAYARAFRDTDSGGLIPLTVEDFAATCAFDIYADARQVAARALASGEALLLLDGLDEVLDVDDRAEASRRIDEFAARCHHDNRLVMTSRIAGYRRASFAGDTPHATLTGFGRDEVDMFAERWARAYEQSEGNADWEDRAAARATALTDAIHGTPQIERLASNPFLVTMLALVQHQGAELPRRRVDLYRMCVETLAESWQRARSLSGEAARLAVGGELIDYRFVSDILGPVAFDLMRRGATSLISREELEERVAVQLVDLYGRSQVEARRQAQEFIELIHEHSGLLTERGPDLYDFLHQTFKEYLAADYLANVEDPLKLLGEQVFAPRLLEVVLLAVARMRAPHATRFITALLDRRGEYDALLQRPLVLACRCLCDDITVRATAREAVTDAISDLFADGRPWRASHVLEHLGDHAVGSAFAEALAGALALPLQGEVRPMYHAAMSELAMLDVASDAVLDTLVGLLDDGDPDVRGEAAHTLAHLGRREADIFDVLLAVLGDDDPARRVKAARSLAGLNVHGERVVETLLDLLQDENEAVRATAGLAFRALSVPGDGVVDDLFKLLEHDSTDCAFAAAGVLTFLSAGPAPIAERALTALERGATAASYLLSGLPRLGDEVVDALTEMVADGDGMVQYGAARALGSAGQLAGRAVPRLLALTANDDPSRRLHSAVALADLGIQDTRVVDALLGLLDGEEPYSSARAAFALGSLQVRDDRVVDALLALLDDEDEHIRKRATHALGQLGLADERVAGSLLSRLEDNDPDVRAEAASACARLEVGYGRAIDTLLTLLHDGSSSDAAALPLVALAPLPDDALDALAGWLRDPASPVNCEAALEVLGASADALADRLAGEEGGDA